MTSHSQWAARLFCAAAFAESLCFYAPVASLYRLEYGLDLFQITLLESVFFVLCLALELPWGFVTARIGYKNTLLAGSALNVLAAFLFWRAAGFGMFLAQRCVLAVSFSAVSGCDTAYLYRLVGPRAAHRALGFYNGAAYAGLLAVGLVFGLVQPLGYRALAFLSLLAALCALALRLPLPALAPEPQDLLPLRQQARALARVLGAGRPFVGFVMCAAVLYEVEHTLTVFLASPAWAAAGIAPRWYGLLSLSLQLAGFAAALASARLTARLGAGRAVALFWCMALAGAALPVLGQSAPVLVLALPLARFACEGLRPCQQMLASARTGGAGRAAALSAYNMAGSLAGAAAGPLVGAAAQRGLAAGFGLGLALLALCGLAARLFYTHMQKGT